MLITTENIDIWYKYYTEQYFKSTKNVKRLGGQTRGLDMLSRAEFEMDFLAEAADKPSMSGTVLAKKMAKQDVYGQTEKQATKQAEVYAEREGIEVNRSLINRFKAQAMPEFFNEIDLRREELKKEGYTSKMIAILIGQEFFGS